MKTLMAKLEHLLELGRHAKGHRASWPFPASRCCVSLFDLQPLPFDPAWVAIVLCGVAHHPGSRHRPSHGF